MPAPNDADPPAMTDDERIAKRRFEAYFVFEMMTDDEFRRRNETTTERNQP